MDRAKSDEQMPMNPNLELAQYHFLLSHTEYDPVLKNGVKTKLMEIIVQKEMGKFYESVCAELGIPVDSELLNRLKEANRVKLEQLDTAIDDATKNLGESEVRDAYQKKAEYLCSIGDKDACLETFQIAFDKAVGVGNRIDIVFHQIRIGLFYMNHKLIKAQLALAKELMEQGGDWDRKNRLKAYEGYYALVRRDYAKASELLLDAVSTFTSYELISFEKLVFYAIVAAMIALERNELRDKVIKSAEIREQLYGQADVRQFLMSLYECDYAGFFRSLAELEPKLKFDRVFAQHYSQYLRYMRAKAYKQLLSSYRSLTLQYMADAFGVTSELIGNELHQFITNGLLHCKIDDVLGIVETSQMNKKNMMYKSMIKEGDILLNRIQKLSRVINT
uniref:26S proteasome non-ATPase regulatory subunit 6 n=1 Tax=Trichuris muris TaxID=70415 RepID=A0A5S6R264_TRIMR